MSRPLAPHAQWMKGKGPGQPYIISAKARLYRNLDGFRFPPAAGVEELESVRDMLFDALATGMPREEDWDVKYVEEIPRLELALMAEEGLIDTDFGERMRGQGVLLRWREGESVMVNGEDHLKVNVVLPGAQLIKAWKIADKVDSQMEEEVRYSYDEKWGYLAARPTNAGTGLRISALLHVPALVIGGEWNGLVMGLSKIGVDVRGLYGDGLSLAGNMVQVSNRVTSGNSEEEIIRRVDRAARQVVEREKTARKMLAREAKVEISDSVSRALGILERAQRLYFYEALELLSLVKLGVEMGILPAKDFRLMELLVAIGPAHLRYQMGTGADVEDLDGQRPNVVRRLLGV